ncbi:MAG: hypothetical protein ABSG43_20630 [Solirubrobacteraceae bacterium]
MERWNGSRWTIQPTPKYHGRPAESLYLLAVSCVSANACTAVGGGVEHVLADAGTAPLAERWNGRRWSIQPTPTRKRWVGFVDPLTGVSCATAKSCTAVGSTTDANGPGGTGSVLIERWNGARWTLEPGRNEPAPGSLTSQSTLSSVSCVSPMECTATGGWETIGHTPAGNAQGTLAESWDGTRWAIQPTSPQGTGMPNLNGVSCSAASTMCTAVGSQPKDQSSLPLVEQSGAPPSAVA